MDKSFLEHYADTVQQMNEIDKRIKILEKQIKGIEPDLLKLSGERVCDSVSGGEGGKQHFHIEGFPSREYQEKYNNLQKKQRALNDKKAEWVDCQIKNRRLVDEVEKFMESLKESSNRTDNYFHVILTYRYIDKKSWQEVAQSVGGGNTADGVRMGTMRFLRTKGIE